MHWPDCPSACKNKRKLRAETWRAMEELYKKGVPVISTLPCALVYKFKRVVIIQKSEIIVRLMWRCFANVK